MVSSKKESVFERIFRIPWDGFTHENSYVVLHVKLGDYKKLAETIKNCKGRCGFARETIAIKIILEKSEKEVVK